MMTTDPEHELCSDGTVTVAVFGLARRRPGDSELELAAAAAGRRRREVRPGLP
jgi:hypothetical protein